VLPYAAKNATTLKIRTIKPKPLTTSEESRKPKTDVFPSPEVPRISRPIPKAPMSDGITYTDFIAFFSCNG
jgi:hypothetical protein